MGWGKRVIQGIEFDLTHLDDAVIDVAMPARDPKEGEAPEEPPSYRVLVSYGSHCFAREVRHDDHSDFQIGANGDQRCMCPIRTALSKNLPKIIREAVGGLAFFSEGKNMLLVEELDGAVGPYAVFFNVRPSTQKSLDVVLFVASAYAKPELPERLPSVPFNALIAKAAKGHTPFRPTRTKAWAKKK